MFASFAQNRCFTAKTFQDAVSIHHSEWKLSKHTMAPHVTGTFGLACLSSCLVQCSPLFGQSGTVFTSAHITILENPPTPTRSSLLVISQKHAFLEPVCSSALLAVESPASQSLG